MVTAVSTITSCNGRQDSRSSEDTQRPPLAPSERDNAAPQRAKGREITSRYLSSRTPTTSCRRTSPKVEGVRRVSVSPDLLTPKRPQSSERCRPATPPRAVAVTPSASVINAVKRASDVPWTSTRTLSVSFQGESFSLPVGRRERPPAATRGTSPEIPGSTRKNGPTPERRRKPVGNSGVKLELHHRWPGIASGMDALTRSLDFADRPARDPQSRVLQWSEDKRWSSVDGRVNSDSEGIPEASDGSLPLDLSSGSESVSSSSNSGGLEPASTLRRPLCTPARFLQEPQSVRSSRALGSVSSPFDTKLGMLRPASSKRLSMDNPASTPGALTRSAPSPIRGPFRSASPSKLGIISCSPSRGMPSPLRGRAPPSPAFSSVSSISSRSTDSVSSILSLADVPKSKKGANPVEIVHSLRLLYNRHLQWRFANARTHCTLAVQTMNAEKTLRSAWVTTSELRDSVMYGRIQLHQLGQDAKLAAILEGQGNYHLKFVRIENTPQIVYQECAAIGDVGTRRRMHSLQVEGHGDEISYLEEWTMLDRDHSSSLSGAIEALEASTLRLPLICCARANVQRLNEAVCSAVGVMQTMGSSICHLFPKVEGMNLVVSKLADVSAQEIAVLDECKGLILTVADLHVEENSLRTHLLQLKQLHDAASSRNMMTMA